MRRPRMHILAIIVALLLLASLGTLAQQDVEEIDFDNLDPEEIPNLSPQQVDAYFNEFISRGLMSKLTIAQIQGLDSAWNDILARNILPSQVPYLGTNQLADMLSSEINILKEDNKLQFLTGEQLIGVVNGWESNPGEHPLTKLGELKHYDKEAVLTLLNEYYKEQPCVGPEEEAEPCIFEGINFQSKDGNIDCSILEGDKLKCGSATIDLRNAGGKEIELSKGKIIITWNEGKDRWSIKGAEEISFDGEDIIIDGRRFKPISGKIEITVKRRGGSCKGWCVTVGGRGKLILPNGKTQTVRPKRPKENWRPSPIDDRVSGFYLYDSDGDGVYDVAATQLCANTQEGIENCAGAQSCSIEICGRIPTEKPPTVGGSITVSVPERTEPEESDDLVLPTDPTIPDEPTSPADPDTPEDEEDSKDEVTPPEEEETDSSVTVPPNSGDEVIIEDEDSSFSTGEGTIGMGTTDDGNTFIEFSGERLQAGGRNFDLTFQGKGETLAVIDIVQPGPPFVLEQVEGREGTMRVRSEGPVTFYEFTDAIASFSQGYDIEAIDTGVTVAVVGGIVAQVELGEEARIQNARDQMDLIAGERGFTLYLAYDEEEFNLLTEGPLEPQTGVAELGFLEKTYPHRIKIRGEGIRMHENNPRPSVLAAAIVEEITGAVIAVPKEEEFRLFYESHDGDMTSLMRFSKETMLHTFSIENANANHMFDLYVGHHNFREKENKRLLKTNKEMFSILNLGSYVSDALTAQVSEPGDYKLQFDKRNIRMYNPESEQEKEFATQLFLSGTQFGYQ